MSFSDSEVPQGGEYKTFRQVSRDRLLHEMLGASKSDKARSSWKVLIMDKVTVKVMSSTCKMADITDQGVSLVEDIFRRREPLPSLDAVYFIQPLKENIVLLLSDMSGREPLYKKAYVYFSSPVPKDLVARIKNDVTVVPRIGALREMNLEYFPMDNQAFVTDHERALEDLFGEGAESSRKFDACLNEMAKRIATVFASLKEFPVVRYQAPKGQDSSSVVSPRHLLPTKLASAIWNAITTYKDSIPNFPKTETCEFLILDRSVDMIAPVIHEWTYDCMCHDLLDMDGNKYVNEVSSDSGGPPTRKEALLEDQDPVWLEIRHSHIADASIKLSDKMDNFLAKNKAAQMQQRDGEDISAREMQRVVQSLSQYNEQKDRLSLHTEIAGRLNQLIRDINLRDLGQLEQDLVFGDAGTKEVINYFRTNQDASDENKLRLMIIYACVSPEKFEGDKAAKLMQLAKLSLVDMKAVKNMKLIEGGSDNNSRKSSGFSLKFDTKKKNAAARKDRTGEEEQWALFRFFPVVEELIENLSKGQLSKDEYKSVNQVSSAVSDANGSSHGGSSRGTQPNPHSMRSRRTATWAKPRMSDDGNTSDSVLKNFDAKKMGQRIFVFIIGGATRSELRVCHKLTTKLRREVILGSTSMDDPPVYITKLKMLSEKELSVSDIRI